MTDAGLLPSPDTPTLDEAATDSSARPRKNMCDVIVRDVVQGLYENRYQPGERLQEAQLTSTYGTSRGPVREALNVLAAMEIVDLSPNRGAQVRVLQVTEAIDILVVAQHLIQLSTRLAALNQMNIEGKERVRSALEKLGDFRPGSRAAEFAQARDSFYGAIGTMAGNAELNRLLPLVRIHLIRVQFRAFLQPTDRTRHRDYQRIAEAILAGKPREAEAAARVHFSRAINCLVKFTTER